MPAPAALHRCAATLAGVILAGLPVAGIPADAARSQEEDARAFVRFVQEFEATCVSRNAVQILVASSHASRTVRVFRAQFVE